jgi:hypothetical protein
MLVALICVLAALVVALLSVTESTPAPPLPPAASAQSVDVSLVMSERFLNNRAREDLKTRNTIVPIRDLTLDVKPENRVIASFTTTLPLLGDRALSIPFQLQTVNGVVSVRAIETPLGAFQVALPLGDLIAQEINDRVARSGEALRFDVVSVTTTEDTIALGLHARE